MAQGRDGIRGQWASVFAMSERNLARLVVQRDGLSFRRWSSVTN